MPAATDDTNERELFHAAFPKGHIISDTTYWLREELKNENDVRQYKYVGAL